MNNSIVEEDLERIAAAIQPEAAALSGKILLLTGGAGFLGSYFVATIDLLNKKYLEKPCKVISIDNFLTGSRKNLVKEIDSPDITFLTHDVRQPLEISGEVNYLIHAAGVASPIYYKKFPLETIDGTIFGIRNMLKFARAHQSTINSVLFFSSSEIYGDPDPNFIPTPETYKGNVSSVGPRSCYDESKRLGETYCATYFNQFGTPVNWVRPFNVYGPGMKPNDFRVIPTFLMAGMNNKPLPVHDKGNQTRTFCYISDAIIGFFKVMLRGRAGEAYNIGNDTEEINMLALAEKVVELFPGSRATLINYPETYPTDEPKRRCPDLTKAKTELDFHADIDLHTGLERSLAWFKEILSQQESL